MPPRVKRPGPPVGADMKRSREEVTLVREGQRLPLITLEGGLYTLSEEAKSLFEALDEPFGVFVLAGPYRSGKSSLLNRLLELLRISANSGNGFAVGNTVQACTRGLWIYSAPTYVKNERGDTYPVFIVDTEGLNAVDDDADPRHDSLIFALAMLAATQFAYNSRGTIEETTLSSISVVTDISSTIQQAEEGETIDHLLPEFTWVVRDFGLALTGKRGEPITSDDYLEQALAERDPPQGASETVAASIQEKNRIRQQLKRYFPHRHCVTMRSPAVSEEDLRRMDTLPLEQLRIEFVQDVNKVMRMLKSNTPPKRAGPNTYMSGSMFVATMGHFVDCINQHKVPVISSSYAMFTDLNTERAKANALHLCDKLCSKRETDPTATPDPAWSGRVTEQCLRLFSGSAMGSEEALQSMREELNETIKSRVQRCEALVGERANTLVTERIETWARDWRERVGTLLASPNFEQAFEAQKETFRQTAVLESLLSLCDEGLRRYDTARLLASLKEVVAMIQGAWDRGSGNKAEVERLKAQLDDLNRELDEISGTLETERARANKAVEDLGGTQANLEEARRRLQEESSQRRALAESTGELEERANKAERSLQKLQATHDRTMSDLGAIREEAMASSEQRALVVELTAERDDLKASTDRLRRQLEAAETHHQTEIEEADRRAQNLVQTLGSRAKGAEERANALQERLATATSEKAAITERLERERGELRTLADRNQSLVAELAKIRGDQERERGELRSLTDRNQALGAELAKARGDQERDRAELRTLTERNQALGAELAKVRVDQERTLSEVVRLRPLEDRLRRANLETSGERDRLTALRGELEGVRRVVSDLEARLNAETEELSRSRRDLKSVRGERDELQDRVERLESEDHRDSSTLIQLKASQQESRALVARNQQLSTRVAELDQARTDLEQQLVEARAKATRAERDLNLARAQLELR